MRRLIMWFVVAIPLSWIADGVMNSRGIRVPLWYDVLAVLSGVFYGWLMRSRSLERAQ